MNKTIIENPVTQIENSNETIIENNMVSGSLKLNSMEFKDYKIIKQLPTVGAEADIYIIERNNKQFILKLYRFEMKPSRDMITKLIDMSNKYPEDIIKIYEISKDNEQNRWYEIQEFAEHGTLKSLIEENHQFVIKNIKEIIKEIVKLLKTIHSQNIIHRDIKPDNILIRTLDPLDLIITDFGISSLIDENMSKKMTSTSGTPQYFSPESFKGEISNKVDYWALGMIILEIYDGGNLFDSKQPMQIAHEIITNGIEVPNNLDKNIQLLLKGLLTKEAEKRWNDIQILKWLNGKMDIPVYYNYNNSNIKEYTFNKNKFHSLETLLLHMYTEENYEKAKEHILRGYITKWLEENKLLDDAVTFETFKKTIDNEDLYIFNLFNHYIKPEKFVFMGKLITLNNLSSYIKNNNKSQIENDIVEYLETDVLIDAYNKYIEKVQEKKDQELKTFLEKAVNLKNKDIIFLINAYINKDLIYKISQYQDIESYEKAYNIFESGNYLIPNSLKEKILKKEKILLNIENLISKDEYENFYKFSKILNIEKSEKENLINNELEYEKILFYCKKGVLDSFDNVNNYIFINKYFQYNEEYWLKNINDTVSLKILRDWDNKDSRISNLEFRTLKDAFEKRQEEQEEQEKQESISTIYMIFKIVIVFFYFILLNFAKNKFYEIIVVDGHWFFGIWGALLVGGCFIMAGWTLFLWLTGVLSKSKRR